MTTDTASIRKQATNSKKPETSFSENRCERCNAELTNERVSVRETLLNAACFLLLLAFLAPLGYVAEQWIQRHLDRPLRHPLWHEPLDNWGAAVIVPVSHVTMTAYKSLRTRAMAQSSSIDHSVLNCLSNLP
jgi:hypothetical protein